MPDAADVVIIGAGIIGMSTAFQIARRSNAKVIVLDKGLGPGEGSTGASSAVCRFRYSHAEMVELAKDGIGAYRHWPEFLGLRTPRAEFRRLGVLWMSSDHGWAPREKDRLAALGVAADVLDDGQLATEFPAISPCPVPPDLIGGEGHECRSGGTHLLERDGGYMDPVDALQDLIEAARGRGVDVRFGSAAADVEVRSGAVCGIRLCGGEVIRSSSAVIAAGPWCVPFLQRQGLDRWPLEPTRVQMVHIDRPPDLPGHLPACVDPVGGIYFRPQNRGQQIILGSVQHQDERETVVAPDEFARYADDDFMRSKLYALQHRLNIPEIRGPVRGYSGLYTVNRADMHPIVGPTPVGGLYVANGCSGHGFKLAPALGALLAREITQERSDFDTQMNPRFLGYEREPIRLEALNVLA